MDKLCLMVKSGHLLLVLMTFILFNLRFGLRFALPTHPLPKLLRIVPHINDTFLLVSGIWLIFLTHNIPFVSAPWLGIKLILLVCYILLGACALKFPPRTGKSMMGYVLAMCCFFCMALLGIFQPVLW